MKVEKLKNYTLSKITYTIQVEHILKETHEERKKTLYCNFVSFLSFYYEKAKGEVLRESPVHNRS